MIAAWLEHLAHDPAMPALLLLPMLPEARRLRARARCRAVAPAACRTRRSAGTSARCSNPARATAMSSTTVSPRRRKELRRQRRRLEEFAPVTFSTRRARRSRSRRRSRIFWCWRRAAGRASPQTAAANDPAVRRFRRDRGDCARRGGPGADRPHAARRAAPSPRRSRCEPATPAGSGRSPTTKASRVFRPACSWCTSSRQNWRRSRGSRGSIPAPPPITR